MNPVVKQPAMKPCPVGKIKFSARKGATYVAEIGLHVRDAKRAPKSKKSLVQGTFLNEELGTVGAKDADNPVDCKIPCG